MRSPYYDASIQLQPSRPPTPPPSPFYYLHIHGPNNTTTTFTFHGRMNKAQTTTEIARFMPFDVYTTYFILLDERALNELFTGIALCVRHSCRQYYLSIHVTHATPRRRSKNEYRKTIISNNVIIGGYYNVGIYRAIKRLGKMVEEPVFGSTILNYIRVLKKQLHTLQVTVILHPIFDKNIIYYSKFYSQFNKIVI